MGTLSCGVAPAVRELCVCLSYKGTYLSGVSPKRKRGRIYLGPLAANTISSGEVASAAVTVFKNAAQTLLTASDASSQYRWVIYSPTTDSAGTGLDLDSWDAVTEGWVDNNVDIQRRRGFSGGTRSTFT